MNVAERANNRANSMIVAAERSGYVESHDNGGQWCGVHRGATVTIDRFDGTVTYNR